MIRKLTYITLWLLCLCLSSSLLQAQQLGIPLVASGSGTPIYADTREYPGVLRALKDLQQDINRVTGVTPGLVESRHVEMLGSQEVRKSGSEEVRNIIIAGSVGRNKVINSLIDNGKLDIDDVRGAAEGYVIQTIEQPREGIDRALVIAGVDMRGTIYGIYEVSKRIGVSPWYWWADVPVRKQENLVFPAERISSSPKVRYRGIFINDEAPALSGWVHENYGSFNHAFYEKVFELILRQKGNFLWPAMWGRSLFDDDSASAAIADMYGVIIGTSHHEPMMRAHVEWSRYGKGDWNYETNDAFLRKFWREGIRRMDHHESIITLAMRGDGDMAMSKETNVSLLERIVSDQRKIIKEETGQVDSIPQVWALYKEVQEYYDQGMRVPEDVTLLLCDDNWGNIRKLPKLSDAPRKGNYGIYYHFDYVGGPRNYKWLNTNQISRVWEQMNLAYQYGVNRLWIVNVGDIKPMEFPISFFMDNAWDPTQFNTENISNYVTQWCAYTFGNQYADEIASMITRNTNYNARRKPELLSPGTYSLLHFREAERVAYEYRQLANEAEALSQRIDPAYRDALFQLVQYPVEACANLNELYITAAKNKLYADQGRSKTNMLADSVIALFAKDSVLTNRYNKDLAEGKWNHFMDQTHIGYTSWQEPKTNRVPETFRLEVKNVADPGVALEGSSFWWPKAKKLPVLPGLSNVGRSETYFEIFNRGAKSFAFSARASKPWVKLSQSEGIIRDELRIVVSVDWSKVPAGSHRVAIIVRCKGISPIKVMVTAYKLDGLPSQHYIETDSTVSILAQHFTRVIENEIKWKVIPDVGKHGNGVEAFPVTANVKTPGSGSPHLEYDIYLTEGGDANVSIHFSPTLNFHVNGLRYAISIDGQAPTFVDIHGNYSGRIWNKWVADNEIVSTTKHSLTAGKHTIKYWLVDPGLVLQKLVVSRKTLPSTYLGPPESTFTR